MASIVADTKLVTLKLFVTSAVKAGKLKPVFPSTLAGGAVM